MCYAYAVEYHTASGMKLCIYLEQKEWISQWDGEQTKPDTKESTVYNRTCSTVPFITKVKNWQKWSMRLQVGIGISSGKGIAARRRHKRSFWGAANVLIFGVGAWYYGCVFEFVRIHWAVQSKFVHVSVSMVLQFRFTNSPV